MILPAIPLVDLAGFFYQHMCVKEDSNLQRIDEIFLDL